MVPALIVFIVCLATLSRAIGPAVVVLVRAFAGRGRKLVTAEQAFRDRRPVA